MNRVQLYDQILRNIGEAELERVRSLIGSKTLREAIELMVDASTGEARLVVPHYWAVYYHDGRGAVSPVNANKLVFFDEPLENDPRLGGRYPVRASELRTLTRDEYLQGLERNAARRAAGLPPFMFVLDRVGPSRPQPFFDQLAKGAASRAGLRVQRLFDMAIQDMVDNDPDVKPEKGIADLHL